MSNLPNDSLLSLVDLILTLPSSNSECERGFSLLKRTKNGWKKRLTNKRLSDLMFVNIYTDDIDKYDPTKAVDLWVEDEGVGQKKSRRPDYKRK